MFEHVANFMHIFIYYYFKHCTKKWSYHDALFFAGTLGTTIGYGNVTPKTVAGKVFCILFCIFGIPTFAYLLKLISDKINIYLDHLRPDLNYNHWSIQAKHCKSSWRTFVIFCAWDFFFKKFTSVEISGF